MRTEKSVCGKEKVYEKINKTSMVGKLMFIVINT